MPNQELVYDWLKGKASWRVYHEGWPIFTLILRMRTEILADGVLQTRFRSFSRFAADFTSSDAFPQVVFIEPKYTPDRYSPGMDSDDHAPSSIAGGQIFFRNIYSALIRNPARWQKTVMIVVYDENGGFFDHRSPLPIRTDPPAGHSWKNPQPFVTTGIRVPALVISPLVEAGAIFSEPMDHTCILKLLGQKFGGGKGYSALVDNRQDVSGKPLSDLTKILTRKQPRSDRPTPPFYAPEVISTNPTLNAGTVNSPFAQAFDKAAQQCVTRTRERLRSSFHIWLTNEAAARSRTASWSSYVAIANTNASAGAVVTMRRMPVLSYVENTGLSPGFA